MHRGSHRELAWEEQLVVASQGGRRGYAGSGATARALRSTRVRVRAIWAVAVLLFAIIFARILYLQIFESGQHILLSEANHIELLQEPAPRGVIYDRNGIPIVANEPGLATESGHTVTTYTRSYPYGAAFAPILGYMSEVTSDELGCRDGVCYTPGMLVGRAGLERTLDPILRGKDGGRLLEIDASGKVVRELGSNRPEAGNDVTLTVDARLQTLLYNAFGGKPGSAVAVDMQGKILAMVSSPSYDPSNIARYLTDTTEHYFLDRAISGTYPPGSVFKLVTSYAALASGAITPTTLIDDTGILTVGQYSYRNWYYDEYGRVEGNINVVTAIAHSNDIFFYKAGEMTGVDTLVSWARQFGFGERTGVELPSEATGLVPDRLQKERATGEKWFLGNTYHLAIGQGDLLVTPLQVARMTAAAVSGRLCDTSLLVRTPINCHDLGLTGSYVTLVRQGMQGACAPGGTAFPFFTFQPWVLCKTGTAQVGGPSDSDKSDAWITVAYPGDNPKMVLTVMLEKAGEGSYEAGPIAKDILSAWRDMGN